MKKISPIWLIDKIAFEVIVKKANTLADILKMLNMSMVGSNYITLKKRIYKEEINIEHILQYVKDNRTKEASLKQKIPINEILIENSTYISSNLKKRLINEKILEDKCYKCGILPIWENEKLSLQLDHINGIHNDNRIENLRILCPNCHSQTLTYGRKNRNPNKCCECNNVVNSGRKYCDECWIKEKEANKCVDCLRLIDRKSDRCRPCANKYMSFKQMNKNTKIQWPEDTELVKLVKELNFVKASKILGVSDNAIRKRLKKRGLF